MANQNGQPENLISEGADEFNIDDFTKDFLEKTIHYDFFSALRLLESLNQSRFGESKTPKEDAILLGQTPHIGFAPNALTNIRTSQETSHQWLDVLFFGLLGPNGALPFHISENIYRSADKERKQTQEFFNIFHHRLISLFYRAWANKEPTAQFDVNGHDRFQFYIGSLAGYGLSSLKNRDELSDYSKIHFAGYFAGKIRHKEGLQNVLHEMYGMPTNVIDFVGEWLPIPQEHQCRLREKRKATQLGINTTLGGHSWQSQYKFQVQLKPSSLDEYKSCLPGTKKLKKINDTIKNYVRDEMQWEIILLLNRKEIPRTHLGLSGRLGWTSWLKTKKHTSYHNITDNFIGDVRLHSEQI